MALRLLVTLDRHWSDRAVIYQIFTMLQINHPDFILIEGEAGSRKPDGMTSDLLARSVAEELGKSLDDGTILAFPADWYPAWKGGEFFKGAGPVRNQEMLHKGQPDRCVAFHDDLLNSKGTRDMVMRCLALSIPVWHVYHAPDRPFGLDKLDRLRVE